MRTTINIDDHLLRQLREAAHAKGVPLRRMTNEALRLGLERMAHPERRKRFKARTFDMGAPKVPMDKGLALSAAMEDEETLRKLELRK